MLAALAAKSAAPDAREIELLRQKFNNASGLNAQWSSLKRVLQDANFWKSLPLAILSMMVINTEIAVVLGGGATVDGAISSIAGTEVHYVQDTFELIEGAHDQHPDTGHHLPSFLRSFAHDAGGMLGVVNHGVSGIFDKGTNIAPPYFGDNLFMAMHFWDIKEKHDHANDLKGDKRAVTWAGAALALREDIRFREMITKLRSEQGIADVQPTAIETAAKQVRTVQAQEGSSGAGGPPLCQAK